MRAALKIALRIGALVAPAAAACANEQRVLFNAAACVAIGVYSAADCGRAERTARAEFNGQAPRFRSRSACERAYAHCMIGAIFRDGGVDFVPRMRGFAILKGPRSKAAPVLEAHRDEASPRASSQAKAGSAGVDVGATAYPVPEALLRDLQDRERRFGGESRP